MNSRCLRTALVSPLALFSFITLITISGCTYKSQGMMVPSDRYAQVAQTDSFGDSATRVVYPEQN